jgi:Glycosyl transferases group 1
MKAPTVLIVCNALDDSTRLQRRIHTDSPAASRKVFLMCQALRMAGIRPYVLSLGRGRADGGLGWFGGTLRRVGGIPTVYAPFTHIRILSELVSLLGLIGVVLRMSRRPRRAVVFYNRIAAYVPTLLVASLTGYRCLLDLEDGEVAASGQSRSWKGRISNLISSLFDRFCHDGALLACTALSDMTRVRPVRCYYGTAVSLAKASRWQSEVVTCLMSGTLAPETGAPILIEAIRILRQQAPKWASQLRFEVTGKGGCLADFRDLAEEQGLPEVMVHGRTTDAYYLDILRRCEVGLALKPVGGPLADTTFPSKVIEFAGAGLMVMSTDISDVRRLLGDGARYLIRNDPKQLLCLLHEVVNDRIAAKSCAERGMQAAFQHCGPLKAGHDLGQFIFGNPI